MLTDLIKNWRRFSLRAFPYVQYGDREFFESEEGKKISCQFQSLNKFRKHWKKNNHDDNNFHLGLLPTPYVGNLGKAKIIILMLNPMFRPLNYSAQMEISFRREKLDTIHQKVGKYKFPFTPLNPRNAWTPGGIYWIKKLNDLICWLVLERGMSHHKALQYLSKRIAVLQLIPYHSKATPRSLKKLAALQSVQDAKTYLKNELVERAAKGKTLIIITRQVKRWGIKKSKNIVIYPRSARRLASLSEGSPAWEQMLNMLS